MTWEILGDVAMAGFWTLGVVAVLHPSATVNRIRAGLVLAYLIAFNRRSVK